MVRLLHRNQCRALFQSDCESDFRHGIDRVQIRSCYFDIIFVDANPVDVVLIKGGVDCTGTDCYGHIKPFPDTDLIRTLDFRCMFLIVFGFNVFEISNDLFVKYLIGNTGITISTAMIPRLNVPILKYFFCNN